MITLISPSDQDIDSISLNPDTVVDTWIRLGRARQTHVP